jgi:hypothetical protein
MNTAPHLRHGGGRKGRGLSLLAAHCTGLDLDAPRARERLDAAIGSELAQKLICALCTGGHKRHAA